MAAKPLAMALWRPGPGWTMMSSGVLGGGIGAREWVLNAQVPGWYGRTDPAAHLTELAAGLGLVGPGVGLLTAAQVTAFVQRGDGGVQAAATVGIRVPTWAAAPEGAPDPELAPISGRDRGRQGEPGHAPVPGWRPGTINIVVAVPVPLTPAAFVNAVVTATEAKSQAVIEAGFPGTGTASDAICVAAPAGSAAPADGRARDEQGAQDFTGPRSEWGARIARAVHAAVLVGATAYREKLGQSVLSGAAPALRHPAPLPRRCTARRCAVVARVRNVTAVGLLCPTGKRGKVGVQAGYAAWMAVLIVVYITLPGLRTQTWSLLYLSVVAAMAAGIFRNSPARKAPWLLLVAASVCFGLAQLNPLTGEPDGHPVGLGLSVEDLLSLVKLPLIAVALALFARARSPGGDRQSLIDALTVTLGLAVLIWIFRVLPGILDPALTGDQRLVMIGFPVGDVLVILALARLLAPGATPRGSLLMISAGVSVGLLADVVYGLIRVYGPHHVPTILDVGWTACFAACGAAALRPDMRAVTQPTPRRAAESSRARLFVLAATTLVAPGLLTYLAFFDDHVREGDIAATATVLYLTVLARLWSVNMSHRRGLLREREARIAGVSLASARTIGDVSAIVARTVTAFIERDYRHETLFAVRAGEELRVVPPATGAISPDASSEIAGLAVTWLPRLRRLASTEPRFVPAEGLDPDVQAATVRAGHDGILLSPLTLTGLSGDPLIGLLAVLGKRRDLHHLKGALGILASQVALAVERVTLTQELVRQRSEAVFRTLVQDTSDVILILDEELTVRYATPSATSIYGDITVEGTPLGNLTAQSERLAVDPALRQPAADGPGREDHFSGLWRITRHDGNTLLVEVRFSDRRADVTVGGYVLTVRDVTEQRQLEDELKHRVFHDALTSLPNRVLFADRAAHGVALARRSGTTAAVLFIDLDDFKIINDTMGHSVGDELLVAVADRLASVTRASDTAARLGGDEFALLIENLADPNAIAAFADRVVTAFTEPFQLSAGSVLTTVTVGVATSDDSSDADQLLRHADLALYAAKSAGKRRWHRYVPTLSAGMVRRREMQAALEEAVTNSAFELAYQPIVTLADGHISGLEALLRWPHPSWGMLMPGQFIDIAEETGHIIPLGAWVLRQAISDLAQWRGPDPDPRQPFVSVNVAARQFRDVGFVSSVRRLLADSGLEPSAMMLELTESGLLHRDDRITSDLAELKQAGVRLAIDDFGTGYSSLSYLRELPIDVLKIDKSFVEGIASSGQRLALAKGIVEIARTLDIDVIAEGIETEEQRTLMTDMGCRYGQGYLLAMPMTWEQAQVLLRSGQGLVPELPPRRAVLPGGYTPPRPRDSGRSSTSLGGTSQPPDPRTLFSGGYRPIPQTPEHRETPSPYHPLARAAETARPGEAGPGHPPAVLLGDASGVLTGAQRGEQHLGGQAGTDPLPAAQPQV